VPSLFDQLGGLTSSLVEYVIYDDILRLRSENYGGEKVCLYTQVFSRDW
jgi:hypothetical protein